MENLFCFRRIDGMDAHTEGRTLLSDMYRYLMQREMPQILIGPQGKPFFMDDSLHFSISHTKSHLFCLLSDTPVGIDSEEISRSVNPRLAEKILSEYELKQYLSSEDKNRALLSFWVMKEAAAKYTGKGINGYPNNTNFSLNEKGLYIFDECIVAAYGKDGFICSLIPTRI